MLSLRNISPNHQYVQSQEFSLQKSRVSLSFLSDQDTDLVLKKNPFLFFICFLGK